VSDQDRQRQQNTEGAIKVRRVTDVHADFDAGDGPGEDGRFFFLFVLDDGAEEFVLEPSVSAGRLLLSMIEDAETLFFDTERRRLVLRKLD
jgi:hypothetical protein